MDLWLGLDRPVPERNHRRDVAPIIIRDVAVVGSLKVRRARSHATEHARRSLRYDVARQAL
jgi:hypothetical protein